MRSIRFTAAVLAILLAVSLFGCGGGETGGGKKGGTLTFDLDGTPVDCSRSSHGGFDTMTSSGKVSSVEGYGGKLGDLYPRLNGQFPGTSPGTFSSPNGGGHVHWAPAAGPLCTCS